ncbi:putative disease resistance protein RGA4 [Triticum aestivum]|uniref:putative disease resistance protein RGA4 n=1 Tax=Triticum aestivum TaxID=4565 RepID=UPI001D021A16|nr:putative disease resistance protein RGA4 [Triticum aestivum]
MDPFIIPAIGWGVSALGWVASPIISKLLTKGFDHLGYDTATKLAQLEPKILVLERVTQVVETSRDRPRLEKLFKELKSAFYEAEEILDAVEYRCLERQIQEGKLQSSMDKTGSTKKLCEVVVTACVIMHCMIVKDEHEDQMFDQGFQFQCESIVSEHESGMSKKKLIGSLKKIEDIINEAHQILNKLSLSSISDVHRRHGMDANRPTTAVSAHKVLGRDNDRDKIIKMIHEKEGGVQPSTYNGLCFSVIGIHGVGGSGKSTLAQLVYAHEEKDKKDKKEGHFDLVMWVHVSQSFRLGDIFKELYEEASEPKVPCPQFNNMNSLEKELERKLDGKRFLLVLDDVWCNKDVANQNLPELLSPLKVGKRGSKILLTTRSRYVFPDLGPDVRYTAMPVPEFDDAAFFELFMHYALEDVQDQRKFESIGAEIAKKLMRSPLAAKTVGGNLRRQQEVKYWRGVNDKDLINKRTGPLWWSYYQLDEQARRCFAYCSIFPRRHRLRRDDLVRLWVAEGFIRSTDEGGDIEEVAEEIFNELLSISFLQPVVRGWEYYYYGMGKDHYLVHDLLHDLAEAVAGSDCFRIDNNTSQKGGGWTGDVPRDVRHLFVQKFAELSISNISWLISLQTLQTFQVWGLLKGQEAKQLRYLNRLSGKLSISGLESVESREEALEVDLAAKKRLTDLTLSFFASSEVAAMVLEGLCPPVGLKDLTIRGYNGLVYPKWMVGRQNGGPEKLQNLTLFFWSQPGPAPALEAFIHLRLLHLTHCSWSALPGNMEHLSSLEALWIYNCSNVRSLPKLPQSLEDFALVHCNDGFMESCQTVGHPNWQNIQHIPSKYFGSKNTSQKG